MALPIFEKNVTDNERAFGPDHLSTLNARGELARMYERVGRYNEAVSLHERNIADYRRLSPGETHYRIWWERHYALALQGAGRTIESITLLRRLLSFTEATRGSDHPETTCVRIFLARACQADGRVADAIELFERCTVDRGRLLGADNSATLNARRNLACAHLAAGRARMAADRLESIVADYVRILGADHPYTKTAWVNLSAARSSKKVTSPKPSRMTCRHPLIGMCATSGRRVRLVRRGVCRRSTTNSARCCGSWSIAAAPSVR